MAVEEEVFRFNLHFAAQNVIKQPLNHWPTYKGYHHLVSAVKDLDVSVQCFQLVIKTVSSHQCGAISKLQPHIKNLVTTLLRDE